MSALQLLIIPFFSLCTVFILSHLAYWHHRFQIYLPAAIIILAPGLVASIYLCTQAFVSPQIINLSFFPKFFSQEYFATITFYQSLFLAGIFLHGLVLLLLGSKRNIAREVPICSFSWTVLFLISTITHISALLFIISLSSALILLYFFIHEENIYYITKITLDFWWLRVSELLLLASILDFGHYSIILTPIFLFTGLLIRLIIIGLDPKPWESPGLIYRIYNFFHAMSTLLIFYHQQENIFSHSELNNFFLALMIILFIYGLIFPLIFKDKTLLEQHICRLVPIAVVGSWITNYNLLAFVGMILLLFFYPLIIILSGQIVPHVRVLEAPNMKYHDTFTHYFAQFWLRSASYWTKFVGPLYSTFLLTYVPQFILIIIQIPLRFFHNGNLQRSLILAAILVGAYFYYLEC